MKRDFKEIQGNKMCSENELYIKSSHIELISKKTNK